MIDWILFVELDAGSFEERRFSSFLDVGTVGYHAVLVTEAEGYLG